MNICQNNFKKVQIVYYSGTGGTQRVSRGFEKSFTTSGCEVYVHRLTTAKVPDIDQYDLLVLIYAVHACNAPEPVYRWIEQIGQVKYLPAVVISVSGGGEVIPNTACRKSCIRKLEKKGFEVIYEKMLVMPSNWIVPTKEPLALLLLEVLPERIEQIVQDVLVGIRRRTSPLLIDYFFSFIGEAEKSCTKLFGKVIKVSKACTGCGWCSRSCPAGNIGMNMNKPRFGDRCQLCLGCIYGCPNKALKPWLFKFIVIKEGYSLKELERKLPLSGEVDIEKQAKGYLWSGVKKYLLEEGER